MPKIPVPPFPSVPSVSVYTNTPIITSKLRSDASQGINFLANRPAFIGYAGSTPSVPSGTLTAIGLDTEITDTWSGHAILHNAQNYYNQAPGWYIADGYAPFTYTSGSQAAFAAALAVTTVSGTSVSTGQQVFSGSGFNPGVAVSDLVQMTRTGVPGAASTDFIQLQAYTSAPGVSMAGAGADFPRLSVRWAGTGSASSLAVPVNAAFPVPPAFVDETWLNENISQAVGFLSNPPLLRYTYVPGSATLGTSVFPAPATVTLNTKSLDNFSAWDSGAGDYPVPRPGLYYISAQVAVANPNGIAADYGAGVTINGTTTWGNVIHAGGAGVGPGTVATSLCDRFRLNSGDVVALAGYQSNVTPVTLLAGTRLVLVWESS